MITLDRIDAVTALVLDALGERPYEPWQQEMLARWTAVRIIEALMSA